MYIHSEKFLFLIVKKEKFLAFIMENFYHLVRRNRAELKSIFDRISLFYIML